MAKPNAKLIAHRKQMTNTLPFEIGYEVIVAQYTLLYIFTDLSPCEFKPTPREERFECFVQINTLRHLVA